MNTVECNKKQVEDECLRNAVDVLQQAYHWLDNGKCLWESQEKFNALMDKIEAVLGITK